LPWNKLTQTVSVVVAFAPTESKTGRRKVNANIDKTRGFEALSECAWVHYDHRIANMEQTKREAGATIRAGEGPAGPKNAMSFGQETILQFRRGNVMEHRETNHAVKMTIR